MRDLHRAVGSLITGRIAGSGLDDNTERLIREGTISGVTLFKDNGDHLEQLLELIADIGRAAGNDDFLVSVDQEGGAVQRFEHIISPMPSALALAALNDTVKLRELVRLQAHQLRLLGINFNLVPVLDVNSNPLNPIIATRSFGDDLVAISRLGAQMAIEYTAGGILSSGKHFPGHGDTAEDSHLGVAVVHADKTTLRMRELVPFIECARCLPSILVSHVWLPAYDSEPLPASLSPNVVTGLLRNEIGYDGFLVTDDMPGMKAISEHWGLEDAAVRSINAGIDHLLMCGTADQVVSVHRALCNAVESGVISEKKVADSLKRRQEACSIINGNLALPALPPLDERVILLRNTLKNATELARAIAGSAVHLQRGHIPDLLSGPDEVALIVPDHRRYPMNLLSYLASKVSPSGPKLTERRYSLDPTPDEIMDVVTFATGKRCIFLSYRSLINSRQTSLSQRLSRSVSADSILVATDVPYDLSELREWPNAVAIFDPGELAMSGLADVIAGDTSPSGSCPVSLAVATRSS